MSHDIPALCDWEGSFPEDLENSKTLLRAPLTHQLYTIIYDYLPEAGLLTYTLLTVPLYLQFRSSSQSPQSFLALQIK